MKYRVLEEQKGKAAEYSAKILVMSQEEQLIKSAICDYLWRDEWFTHTYSVVPDAALQMSKVLLRWKPRRVVFPRLEGGAVLRWGLWWYGETLRDEDLWLGGLMLRRNCGDYAHKVYLHPDQCKEEVMDVRGYGDDVYLVTAEPWAAVPCGYLILE